MNYKLIATPAHKNMPENKMAVSRVCPIDGDIGDYVADVVVAAIDNVRRAGHDMRDDWSIILTFKSAA